MSRAKQPPAAALTRRILTACLAAACAAVVVGVAIHPAAAAAATQSPAFTLDNFATPTNFTTADNADCPGGNAPPTCDAYQVVATNAGAAPTDGSTVTLTDTLPAGVTAQSISLYYQGPGADANGINNGEDFGAYFCDTTTVTCTSPFTLQPDDLLKMVVWVTVDPNASGQLTNMATASGGGAPNVSATTTNQISSAKPSFGPVGLRDSITGPDGQPYTQAGGHPYELTTRIELASMFRSDPGSFNDDTSVEDLKDVVVDLPLGLVGSALAAQQCTLAQLSAGPSVGNTQCPPGSVVGHIRGLPLVAVIGNEVDSPIFNMVPERGVAAEFGYMDIGGAAHVLYARVVPSPNGYVLQVTAPDAPQIDLTDVTTTFYGNPAAKDGTGNAPAAMFTNPSDCNGQPLTTTVHIDSWQHPARFNADGTPDLSDPNWKSMSTTSPPVTGCNLLQFNPSMSLQPDTTVADSPSGLSVDIKLPQSEDPSTLATPPLKDASVTLPPGFTVDPSSADGLGSCSSAQIALSSADPPSCPSDSQIGTAELTTPLLPGTLQGEIYLASEFDNPFHSLLAGYIVVDDPTTGVVIKIPGNLTPNPVTGQITGVFDNNPQFPFSDLQLEFKGGPRGVLATPESCGTFTTSSVFSPWSFPDSGPAATPSDSFSIDSGCVSGFKPSFTALSQNAQAGAYSPFVLSLSRSDTDQNFQGLVVRLPPGMLAKLAGVGECSEQDLASISSAPGTGQSEINDPSCPANSQVGTVTTGAGTGPDPFFLDGKVYLTGPYKGAPYGLAVVVPAVAGPLDLGTVVVRQALDVDPTTAQVTDVSDPFPTILDGIPLRIRRVDVDLNRPEFTVNPTSCDPMSINAIASSTQGTVTGLSSRFAVGGCQELGFSPKLKMSLTGNGRTRSKDHPTLTATLTQPSGQANLKSTSVALPLSLALDPSNSNNVCSYAVATAVHGGAVGCPAKTVIGSAVANTPLLSEPLTGKVYLVQGIRCAKGQPTAEGACPNGQTPIHTYPSLLIPLRGQIALDLRTSALKPNAANQLVTTFATIPDAPVSKFTLTINGGPLGLLVITGLGQTICGKSQVANASYGAQSGKTSTQDVTMSTPCGKPASLEHSGVKHDKVWVTVHLPGPGKLHASGKWLKRLSRRFGKAQTATLDLHLTEAGVARLDHKHHLQTHVTLNWTPSGGGTHPMETRILTINR